MALKLSIFTTTTDPDNRGDNWVQALKSYRDLADEVVVVDATAKNFRGLLKLNLKVDKTLFTVWPKEFEWPLIGQQFQRGYEACSGDWVIHADLDFIFHEQDFENIRKSIEENNNAPALTFWKYQFIQPDRYNLKSRLVLAVNKGKYGNRIRFDSGGDLCQPSLDGQYLRPGDIPEARVPFYNYEKLTKTKEQIIDDVERMDRAYQRHFGTPLYSNENRTAYDGWIEMAIGRYHKPAKQISLNEHPKYIRDTILNLTPDQFGHSAFGLLKENYYVQSRLR